MFTPELLQNISQSKATLKIITKTKNERLFIEKWIQHHLAIIGEGKLIIFDNMSDDEEVLKVYEKYKDYIIVIVFNSHHNSIHYYQKLKKFYDVIAQSTDFFTVLDSDEFLYLYDSDNNRAVHDTSILDYLKNNTDCDFFAPFWLDNLEGEENLLLLNSWIFGPEKPAELTELFHWGKPIINSKILKRLLVETYAETIFCHTHNLPALNYQKAQIRFFIAHLKNLNVQQRISSNMNKLVSDNILSSNDDFKGLLELNITKSIKLHPDAERNMALRSYVIKTQRLLKGLKEEPFIPKEIPSSKVMEIGKDNQIYFANKFSKQAFSRLANSNYLYSINYDYAKVKSLQCKQLWHWLSYINTLNIQFRYANE